MEHRPLTPSAGASADAPPHPAREHHLDGLRALLMLAGIPFHAAHPYRDDGQSWSVVSADHSAGLTHFMEFMHLFRMPAFFAIAGYFTAMLLLKRDTGAYLQSRLIRLLPPLVAGLLIIVPLTNLAAAMHNAPDAGSAMAAWIDQSLTLGRTTTGHLWFVIVLVYYSCATAILSLVPSVRTFRLESSYRPGTAMLAAMLVVTGVVIGGYQIALLKLNPFIPDLMVHPLSVSFALQYAPYFALGVVLNRLPAINARFNRFSLPIAVASLAIAAIAIGVEDLPKYTRPVLQAIGAVGLTQSTISGAGMLFRTESRTIRELVDASFVIYLVHLPIIIAAFGLVDAVPVHYFVRYVVLTVLSFGLSLIIWILVRRSSWLLFFLSGVRRK